jgi:hypothetical protein
MNKVHLATAVADEEPPQAAATADRSERSFVRPFAGLRRLFGSGR